MPRERQKRTECPNCGNPLAPGDNFCSRCGQENHTHKLPLRHFIVELLSGVLNFDTKLALTLRDLFVPPGLVIRNYNNNQRARYVPPLRLYLFTSVLFFLALNWVPTPKSSSSGDVVHGQQIIPPSGQGAGTQKEAVRFTAGTERMDSVLLERALTGTLTDAVIDSMLRVEGAEPGPILRRMVRTAVEQNLGGTHRSAFMERFTSNAGKALFFTMPVFALLLHLFHWRRKGFFTEHLVFALYFHVVYFAMLLLQVMINGLTEALWGLTLITAFPVFLVVLAHLTWSIRTVHQRPWWISMLKALVLAILYALVVALALGLVAIVTAAT